jgi:hypothetical protein
MTQAEAKMRILAEWRTWVGHRQTSDSHTRAGRRCSSERLSKITPTRFRLKVLMTSGSL